MSAPSGYNPNTTMIAPSGGAIHAMSGGFSSSPYPPGTSASMSLLPDVKGPIDIYRGGANDAGDEEENIAVAAAVAMIANEDDSLTTTKKEEPKETLPAATAPTATTATNKTIATTTTDATDATDADIAVTAAIANIANEEKKEKSEEKPEKSEENSEKSEDTKSKKLDIFGTIYEVSNPLEEYDQFGWDKLIDSLHLSKLPPNDLNAIKIMIYNKPNCLSQNFVISTNAQCEPIRQLINTVIIHALKSGIMDQETITQINILFGKSEWISELSKVNTPSISALSETNKLKINGAAPLPVTTIPVTTATTGIATVSRKEPDQTLKKLLVETVPTQGVAPTVPKPIPDAQKMITDTSDNLVSTTGISNEPTIACYAITSLQYLFSIPEFITEILKHNVNRSPPPAMNYDNITNKSVDEIIKKVTSENPSLPYDITGENQLHVKDALYYIITTLLQHSIPFSEAASHGFTQNDTLPTSLGKAIMYLMTQFILYLNSSSTDKNRFHTQQDAADFIRFILMICDFKEIDELFRVVLESTVTPPSGTASTTSTSETSLVFLAQKGTIESLFDAYQQSTKVDYTMQGTNVQADKTIKIDLNNTRYLHITINRQDNTIPITIEPNITLLGRKYKLIGTILRRGTGSSSGHYRYIRMNAQSGKTLENTPSILYDDRTVTYHNTLTAQLINEIQTQCRELLYVFIGNTTSTGTSKSLGGRIKRVIRRNRYVRDM